MPFKGLKEREKELRREYIVNAAEKMFFSKNYDNVSMDDIAREAGLNKATIYQYFRSKEALFFAVVVRAFRIEKALLGEHMSRARTGIEMLGAVGSAYFEFVKKYPDYQKVTEYFIFARFDLESQDSDDLNEIKAYGKEKFLAIYDSIKIGMKDETIRPGFNPIELTVLISLFSNSLVNIGPYFEDVLRDSGISHDRFIADSRTFLAEAIVNKEKSSPRERWI